MEEEFQPILLEDLEIQCPDFELRRLALNRHMPRVERLSEHVHDFSQILVYFRGHGVQHLDGEEVEVARGSVLFIPQGTRHRFEKERTLRPVCLAIDFSGSTSDGWLRTGRLPPEELAEVERLLVELNEWEKLGDGSMIRVAALVFQILERVREALTRSPHQITVGPVVKSVLSTIRTIGLVGMTPGIVARELGYSLDHLNRRLKEESGMTVGRLINRERTGVATRLLKDRTLSIGEVGSEIGIYDQNYFARWFRQQTGQSPTVWREAMG